MTNDCIARHNNLSPINDAGLTWIKHEINNNINNNNKPCGYKVYATPILPNPSPISLFWLIEGIIPWFYKILNTSKQTL